VNFELGCNAWAAEPRRAALPRRPGPTFGGLAVKRSLLREALTVRLRFNLSLPLPWPGPSGGLAAESSTWCWGRRGAGVLVLLMALASGVGFSVQPLIAFSPLASMALRGVKGGAVHGHRIGIF
jgi:hypothetical protein